MSNGKMLGTVGLQSTASQELLDALSNARAEARKNSATPSMLDQHTADVMRGNYLRDQLLIKNIGFQQFERYDDDTIALLLTPDQAMHLAHIISQSR